MSFMSGEPWFDSCHKQTYSLSSMRSQLAIDPLSPYLMDGGALAPCVKWHEPENLHLTRGKVNNACIYTSIPPYVFIAWRWKQRRTLPLYGTDICTLSKFNLSGFTFLF
jgi:hypothetical protein